MVCWGDNTLGQLGDGRADGDCRPPRRVAGITDAVQVAAGDRHTCLRRRSGQVLCFGNEAWGLPSSPRGPRALPTAVPGIDDAVDLTAGPSHSCALRRGGEVLCWGLDVALGIARRDDWEALVAPTIVPGLGESEGIVGRCIIGFDGVVRCLPESRSEARPEGVDGAIPPPAEVPGLRAPLDLAVSHRFACALEASREVSCWGPWLWMLGTGPRDRGVWGVRVPSSPTPLRLGSFPDVLQVAAGGDQLCMRHRGGQVTCRGDLVPESRDSTSIPPPDPATTVLAGVSDAVEVAVSHTHACLLRATSEVLCWGDNAHGQLGAYASGFRSSSVPIPVGDLGIAASAGDEIPEYDVDPSPLDEVEEVRLWGHTVCARRRSGPVLCWGSAHSGRLGVGSSMPNSPTPSAVPLTEGAHRIVEIGDGLCALRRAGPAVCWGPWVPLHGEEVSSTTLPEGTVVPGLEGGVEAVTSGRLLCARNRAGEVLCRGSDHFAMGRDHGSPFVRVAGISAARQLVASRDDVCAVTASGVRCFGSNVELDVDAEPTGVLGIEVRQVPHLGEDVLLTPTAFGFCALAASGQVSCWGVGGLGSEPSADAAAAEWTPEPVPAAHGARELAGGFSHVCARLSSGQVLCWGGNEVFQVAPDGSVSVAPPSLVPGLDDATQLSARHDSTCALRATGQVLCWGDNRFGELGNGSTSARAGPALVRGLADAVRVEQDGERACALRATGHVVCWGSNRAGQLGDGTAQDRAEPVTVVAPRAIPWPRP